MNVEDAAKYFNDCKPKHLRKFEEKTPEGNLIKGYICKKPNRYLGSVLITELNGEPHEQFVQSMPKIDYFEDERDISDSEAILAYEKLDGSCLILYPILDENGYIVEIVPKTRGRAVADNHFLDLYSKVDKSKIWDYYRENKGILYFEMYGILNQHEIIHYDTGVNIALIGCYTDHFYNGEEVHNLAKDFGFHKPDAVFGVLDGVVYITSEKYRWYFREVGWEDVQAPTKGDAIDVMVNLLDYLNKTYNDMYGRIATEGVVVNCVNHNGVQKYIKVKPHDIENKHRSMEYVSRKDIRKEVLKYFDEYGSEVYEIYQKDKNHHTEYIHRMLSEEYNDEMIQKSKKKIEKIFMEIWNAKEVPQSLHDIANELIEEYGDKGITHCMRMFGQKYPMKKKDASTIYGVLRAKGVE